MLSQVRRVNQPETSASNQDETGEGGGPVCPYLFPARPPTRPVYAIQREWERIREEAGLPGVRLHDLRHSSASTAEVHGMEMVTVARLPGHALVETTERYFHSSDRSVADAAD